MDLYLAIKTNDSARVENILEAGFDLKAWECYERVTFVSLAVLNDNLEILDQLVSHGADVNRLSYISYKWPREDTSFDSFEMPLITATRHNSLRICRYLLEKGAKINKTDSFNMTALHWACSLNLAPVVELFFRRAELNVNILDLKNQNPLEKAIFNGNTDVVILFMKRNFPFEYKFRDFLLAAIKTGNFPIFKLLLDQLIAGKILIDLNVVDETVGSVLHYAVMLSNSAAASNRASTRSKPALPSSQLQIVSSLVELDQCEVNIVNRLGQTPLHMCKNVEIARILLDKGASMSIRECTGKEPLFTCICSSQFDMCLEMLKRGCKLENIDRLGNSLLYALLLNANTPFKLIYLLLEAGLTLDAKADWLQKGHYPNKRLIQKYPKLVNLIEYKLKNPPSLKALARNCLRAHLNRVNRSKSILGSVGKLEKLLPSALQDYILLNLNKLESILMM